MKLPRDVAAKVIAQAVPGAKPAVAPVRQVPPVTLTIEGVRVESESNRRDAHWSLRAKRARAQGDVVRLALAGLDKAGLAASPRLRVTLQRIMGKRGREFDGDNLAGAMKFCRDAIARAFQVDDGDPWWIWTIDPVQVRGSDHGVRITFEPLGGGVTDEGKS